jgi:hypothetical protein
MEESIKRFNKFQHIVMGTKADELPEEAEVSIQKYAKSQLKDGNLVEKRELLANLQHRSTHKDKTITLNPILKITIKRLGPGSCTWSLHFDHLTVVKNLSI